MAHRYPKPGDVKTTDRVRLEVAFIRCIECLMGDLRIEPLYGAWLARRDIERLERLGVHLVGDAAAGPSQERPLRGDVPHP